MVFGREKTWRVKLRVFQKEAFNEKFYMKTYREEKHNEFLHLLHGEMTVAKYGKKFTELAKYALTMVDSKKERCRRFEKGLKQEIRMSIAASVVWCKFSKLVEAALRVRRI